MIKIKYALCGLLLMGGSIAPAAAEDSRQMVKMPEMMIEHMLGNMRDHLRAIDEIMGELTAGNADGAAKIAEERLGMSSLGDHGAAHIAKFMPEGMKAAGTAMHRAASRFGIEVKNAELAPGRKAQRRVYKALQEITGTCVACHQGYRVR